MPLLPSTMAALPEPLKTGVKSTSVDVKMTAPVRSSSPDMTFASDDALAANSTAVSAADKTIRSMTESPLHTPIDAYWGARLIRVKPHLKG